MLWIDFSIAGMDVQVLFWRIGGIYFTAREFILLLCYSKFHHIFRIHLQHSVGLAFVVLLMDIELRYGGKFAFSS